MPQNIVIIGAGQAGLQAAATLRAEGFDGSVTLIGEEPFAPYQRPPLSKAYLLGKMDRERLFLKPERFYEENCTLITGAPVRTIDRENKTVILCDDRVFAYDRLLIATGTRARALKCPGADLPGVHVLRSIADVDSLRPEIQPGRKAVIVGAGYIGLEVAAVAAQHGLDVTVVEFLDRVLARSLTPMMSEYFTAAHEAHGVKFRFGIAVEGFEGTDHITGVRAGGESIPADFVLAGIGAIPNAELAAVAGLKTENGAIVVDAYATTSDPDIFAAGDVTWHPGYDGEMRRLESVQNAIDQAKCAARAMMGNQKPYAEVPWFWSDQYDMKLQIAGLAREGDAEIVRGDPKSGKFSVFYLRDNRIASVVSVNKPADHLMARRLIAAGTAAGPEAVADPAVALKDLIVG